MLRGVVVGLVAGVVIAGAVAPASAEPSYPTEQQIDDARRAEADAGDTVAAVERQLAAINAELDTLRIASAKAVEAYNGARIALADAEAAETAARERAAEAAAAAEAARRELGALAAASYRNGGELSTVSMILTAKDGQALYDGISALRSITSNQAGVHDRAQQATKAAEQAAAQAEQALDEQVEAADLARSAFAAAERAVSAQEGTAAAMSAEREQVLAQLAAARGTTLELERERQQGLADEAAAERERQARAAALSRPEDAAPTSEPAGQPASPAGDAVVAPPAAQSPEPAPSSPAPAPAPAPKPAQVPAPAPAATPKPTSPPSTTAPAPKPPARGAQAAVDYAYAQLGKPYEWGADGPDSFDCSGLTMRAWQAGGLSLPHWSVAQATAVSRVSYAQLRPGDLVFWSDNGRASGTYHVGLYIGNNRMIHAPRPGKSVELQSIFYWITPSFYGRP